MPPATLKQYQDYAQPKAIATAKTGAWSWFIGDETILDSEKMALFDCDQMVGADAFLDTPHTHACVIVDRNGERLAK